MTLKEPTRPRSPSHEPPACDAAAAFIPVDEEAGSTLRPERDRDDGWECLVAGELPRAALRPATGVAAERRTSNNEKCRHLVN
jgi:hypothetical protein